ncbi:MAG: fibronectin type III domain-containing protein [Firmicutes bacterium]|nr:fibronectin type III domain-containing protein [Bacillota bacterium]MDY5856353.1 fibronectin type III domain-containing protein [Anaerovoracaceae bacterium]
MKNLRRILCTILCFVMIFTTGITAFADTASAAAGDSALEDGTYTFGVMTSTKMFKITPEDNGTCQAVVKDGKITATIRLSGDGYSRLYIGPAEEAAALEASNPNAAAFIPYKKDADGKYTYEVPVEALNTPIQLSARGTRWYDRVIVFYNVLPQPVKASYTIQGDTLRLRWTKAEEPYISGYEIACAYDAEFTDPVPVETMIDGQNTTSAKVYLEKGDTYYLKVRSIITIDGLQAYSDWSNAVAAKNITVAKPKLSSVTAGTSKAIVKWTKKAVTGYEIQYGTSPTFKASKTIKIGKASTVSKTIKSLKKGKTYYFRIRSYQKTADGVCYSDWTAKKSIKIK